MDKSQSPKKLSIAGVDYVPAELFKNAKDQWRISFYVKDPSNGKLKRVRKRVKPISNKKEREVYAKTIIADLNNKLRRGWNPFIENENVAAYSLFTDCMDEFFRKIEKQVNDNSLRPDTLRAYRSYINMIKMHLAERNETGMFVINFKSKFISNYLDWIYYDRGNSPTTHNNHLQFLINLGNYFVKKEYIANNPAVAFRKIPEKEKVQDVIPNEVRAKIKAYLEITNKPYLCLCMMTYYGLTRRTELTKMMVSDVNLAKGVIVVRRAVSKSNKKEEAITIPLPLLQLLADHLKYANNNMYLFSATRFKPGVEQLKPKRISDEWTKMRNALKLEKKYIFYDLKATGITELLESGIPSYKVQKQARHSDLKMTERYIRHKNYDKDSDIFNAASF